MSIFKDNAPKYFELGLAPIPLNGKVPVIKNWAVWNTRPMTDEELDWLIDEFPNANVGVLTGTKFIGLDIDTNDIRVLHSAPLSPIIRRGSNKSGFISLFNVKSDLGNIVQGEFPIEVLGLGRQIAMAPSIHPDTKEVYSLIGDEDIYHMNFDELPVLTQADIDKLRKVCNMYGIKSKRARKNDLESGTREACLTDVGRNNRLSCIAYAMACDGVDPDEGAERLLETDIREHDIPWFSDKTEPHRGKDPLKAATRMFERAIKSATKKGDRIVHEFTGEVDVSQLKPSSPPRDPEAAFPQPRGVMKMFVDYCELSSRGRQDRLGLGASIALMGAICSNRYRTEIGGFDVWPNVYVMNLAGSGRGKEPGQRAIRELLLETTLIGSAGYKSASSIVSGLIDQQERVDVIDEFSTLIRAMSSSDDFKSDIVELLNQLFSSSSSHFLGTTSATKGKGEGACWNPCVSILGSLAASSLKGAANKAMASKGLLPRFLVFWQKELGEFKPRAPEAKAEKFKDLHRWVRKILSTPKIVHPDSQQINLLEPRGLDKTTRYLPLLIPATDHAEKYFEELSRLYFDEGKLDEDAFESAFKNRFMEHTAKLALMDTVSLGLAEIGVENIEWAHAVVRAQWAETKDLYELVMADNKGHEKMLRILKFFEKNPKHRYTLGELPSKNKGDYLPSRERKDILNDLVDQGKLVMETSPTNKATKYYRLNA